MPTTLSGAPMYGGGRSRGGRGRGRGRGGGRGGDFDGRGGGGRGGGGGQRWWDPEWRNQKLQSMREESGRSKVDLDEGATLDSFRSLLTDDSRSEIVIRENVGREGGDLVESLARSLRLHFKPYGKGTNTVLCVSKVALPDYRADLDARRNARAEVEMSENARRVVEAALNDNTMLAQSVQQEDKHKNMNDVPQTKHTRSDTEMEEVPPVGASSANLDAEFAVRERTRSASSSSALRTITATRSKLPAFHKRAAFLKAVSENIITIVSGETGCGKTTQLPQFILEQALLEGKYSYTKIVCTQPRRISAVSVAQRVAEERDENLGNLVGYKIRGESKVSQNTKLTFCTTGVLLRQLIENRHLTGITHIFVDEIHERGIYEDFLLIVLKQLCKVRTDLKIVLMSATLDAAIFSEYFSVEKENEFHVPGFTHPVNELFLEDVLSSGFGSDNIPTSAIVVPDRTRPERSRFGRGGRGQRDNSNRGYAPDEGDDETDNFPGTTDRVTTDTSNTPATDPDEWSSYPPDVITSLHNWLTNCANDDAVDTELVKDALVKVVQFADETERKEKVTNKNSSNSIGAVLVFLTGWDDICKVKDLCASCPVLGDTKKTLVLPLHGSMPTSNQREIFDRPRPGVRKIILSTNIAETSITIEDVVYVIDCGKSKEKSYDALNDMACLSPNWISRASAHQRRGRAGRVRPGFCVRIYTRQKFAKMKTHALPEMLRTPLEELVLSVKSLKLGTARDFVAQAINPPPPKAVINAVELLCAIGAIRKENESLTALGTHLINLPVTPRVGKMLIVACALGCVEPALTVAAATATRDPFVLPMDKKQEADLSRREFSRKTHSDHVAIAVAFHEWQYVKNMRGNGAARTFAKHRFLSHETMERMVTTRKQFAGLLEAAGFKVGGSGIGGDRGTTAHHRSHGHVSSHAYDCNQAPFDIDIFRAVLCAGLFPKLACVKKKGRRNKLKTHEDGSVDIHPSSVNSEFSTTFPFKWLVYGEKVKTQKVFLRDSTCVPTYAVLLLGGSLDVVQDDDTEDSYGVTVLDGAYTFAAPSHTVSLIRQLRDTIDKLLTLKARDPGFEFNNSNSHGVIGAVKALMAEEEAASNGGRFGGGDKYRGSRDGSFFYNQQRNPPNVNPNGQPGDWSCPRGCGVVFASKVKCFRCGVDKPE